MERKSSDLAYTEKDLRNEIISFNATAVLSNDINNGSVSDFQELKNLISNNHNILSNVTISDNNCVNEIPSDYEDVKTKKLGSSVAHESQLPPKVVTPTIFENAVQAVKNLFSPVKAQGLFSRGVIQPNPNQPETKSLPNGNIKILNEDFLQKMEELPTNEHKMSISDKEINLYLNEDDIYNTILRSGSDIHNNTNDSYTSTVSRMDDSFKSTVTHFDELTQNEAEMPKAGIIAVERTSGFESSLNNTIDAIERSLNNTLMRNLSFSSIENGEMNTTLKGCNANNSNNNNNSTNEINQFKEVYAVSESSAPKTLESFASGTEKGENKISELQETSMKNVEETLEIVTEMINGFRESKKSMESIQEEANLFKDISLSSTPNKQISSEDIKCLDKSFIDLVSTKLTDSVEEEHEVNRSETYSCLVRNVFLSKDTENFDQNSATNNSVSTPKVCSDLEKNFITSTMTTSKSELTNKENQCERTKRMSTDGDEQILVALDKINEKNLAVGGTGNSGYTSHANEKNNGSLIPKTSENTEPEKENLDSLPLLGQKNIVENEPAGNDNSLNSQSSKEMNSSIKKLSFRSDLLSSYSPNHGFLNLDILSRTLLPESENQITSENCFTDEIEIPLAAQRSYTVLHNTNPNLNRPVVLDTLNNSEAYTLNDIILGSRTFSDFSVTHNGDHSDSVICNAEPKSPNDKLTRSFDSSMIDKRIYDEREIGCTNTGTNPNILENNVLQNIKRDFVQKKDLKLNNLVLLPLSRSRSVIDIESDKDVSKKLRQTESLSSLNTCVENAVSKAFREKIQKNSITIIKPHDSSTASTDNTSETDIFALQVKEKEDKNSLKEPEPNPEIVKNITNELSEETVTGSTKEKSFCGDDNTSKKSNHGKEGEKIDSNSSFNVENKCEDLTLDCLVLENIFQNPVSNDTQKTDFNLGNVKTDFEMPQMNNATNEQMKEANCKVTDVSLRKIDRFNDSITSRQEELDNSKNTIKASGIDTDLTQLIQEQFTPNDIEKVFSVVDDIPELNLSKNIVLASQQFDKSFHEKNINELENIPDFSNCVIKDNNDLDFLDSIKGKPSGRDYSRESLYVKFDPLLQSKRSPVLFDISEGDKENVANLPLAKNTNLCDSLVTITPLKQAMSINSLSPLTPTLQNTETKLSAEKSNKLRELSNEITRLKEFYSQREEINKEKMNNYQNKITQLTEKACVLEDKLKESEEMEKCLVRKLNTQNESIKCLKNIIEEYLTHISTLTDQIEKSRRDNQRNTATLKEERDYYMNHLQNTEQAFSDVHSKYEKCKKAVEIYKKNEETYKSTIEDLNERIEQYNEKVKGMKENTERELNRFQDKMNAMKATHSQEISRFKAQLRKTELKVQTIQEALEQKIKENQELAGICDELIEGKKSDS